MEAVSTMDSSVSEEVEEEEEEGEEKEDGEEKKRRRAIRRRRVTTMLWDGTFCRHLQASANFVQVDASVECIILLTCESI